VLIQYTSQACLLPQRTFVDSTGLAYEKILFAIDVSSAAGVYRGLLDSAPRWRQVRISL
jgi:hypothetical protein